MVEDVDALAEGLEGGAERGEVRGADGALGEVGGCSWEEGLARWWSVHDQDTVDARLRMRGDAPIGSIGILGWVSAYVMVLVLCCSRRGRRNSQRQRR